MHISPFEGMDKTKGLKKHPKQLMIGGEMKTAELTVEALAWQVKRAQVFKLNSLLEVHSKASGTLDIIPADNKDHYITPFIAIGDRHPEIRGSVGPIWPKLEMGNPTWEKQAPLNKGPTGRWHVDIKNRLWVFERIGFVYGTANYATTDNPNKVYGKYAVTSKVDVHINNLRATKL